MIRTIAAVVIALITGISYGQVTDQVFDVVVAHDNSGDYTTLQAAIDAAPVNSTQPYLIFIKNGEYDELINIPEEKPFLHIIGQDVEKTVIRHMIHCGGKDSEFFEYSVNNEQSENYKHNAVMDNWGSDFYMENITLENTWGTSRQTGPQALAIRTCADRMAFYNCRFRSFQDTWFTTVNDTDRHYIKNCLLEGAIDYIFGSGNILAEGTTFYNVRSGSVITAPSHTESTFGYVFRDCIIDGNEKAADGKVKFGRPWHNNPKNIWINTTLRIPIDPRGWTDMGTIPALFTDYNTHDINGLLSDVSQRKKTFSYRERNSDKIIEGSCMGELDHEDVKRYTYENMILSTDKWNPKIFMAPMNAPHIIKGINRTITWEPVEGARGYVITNEKSQILAITKKNSFFVNRKNNYYIIQAVSEYGHLGCRSYVHFK